MILLRQSAEILKVDDNALQITEEIGRGCYQNRDKITLTSAANFCKGRLDAGHGSIFEHCNMTVRFITDRGMSHELVRHRHCAFTQESSRYVDYSKNVPFIIPPIVDLPEGEYPEAPIWASEIYKNNQDYFWATAMEDAEKQYKRLVSNGWPKQFARSVLPTSTKTELTVTANFWEWRWIFFRRVGNGAHPQMTELIMPVWKEIKNRIAVIFDKRDI